MLASSSTLLDHRFLIIRHGEQISSDLNQRFFNEVYSLVSESPFLGKVNQKEFWDEVEYEDLSALKTDDEIETIYNDLLIKLRPDIVFLFGCNPIDNWNIDWREYEYKKVLCGFKVFRAEMNLHRNDNHQSYQINLQDPLSKDYKKRAMIKLLNWFGDKYYS